MSATSQALIAAARRLSDEVAALAFAEPVHTVYNPLDYAWAPHECYLTRYGATPKRVLLMGMNPGPWGMAQTGVPFGEIAAVRDWMGIEAPVERPAPEHPKRPIEGFACERSEVSGRRLWELFAERFESAEAFFAQHFVANYCPLVFMEATGRNRTPDALPAAEARPLMDACDRHLRSVVEALQPEWLVGVGGFAEKRLQQLFGSSHRIGKVLHPSPASPHANRGWAEKATEQLRAQGIWSD